MDCKVRSNNLIIFLYFIDHVETISSLISLTRWLNVKMPFIIIIIVCNVVYIVWFLFHLWRLHDALTLAVITNLKWFTQISTIIKKYMNIFTMGILSFIIYCASLVWFENILYPIYIDMFNFIKMWCHCP